MAKTSPNKQKLINDLKARGLHDLAERAQRSEFSDFASNHATPIIMLVKELEQAGAKDLANNARNGVYDHDE